MGKREEVKFAKKPRDSYFTIDPAAVQALAPYLPYKARYIEPCAGAGHLIDELSKYDKALIKAFDIEPQKPYIIKKSALDLKEKDLDNAEMFISNPPFTWSVLQPLMDHMISLLPTWLLLPADYMHNIRMAKYMNKCSKVVSVGRLYWEENKVKGVDNYCWYLFEDCQQAFTNFIGRNTK